MKKTICNIRTLAALLVAGAAFTACSNEDNYVEEAPQYYTMTVNATKDANTTRALSLADPSSPLTSALNATWTEGDEVTVTKGTTPVGTLTASNITNSGKTATFSGQIANTVQATDVLTLTYHPVTGLSAFENQTGTLASASDYDVAVATVTVTDVTGGVISISGSTTFYAQTAVVQLILEDASNTRINATSLKITAAGEDVFTFTTPAATYTTNGNGILYFALPSQAMVATALAAKSGGAMSVDDATTLLGTMPITFTASDGTNTYTATKAQGYTFEARTYYGSTLTLVAPTTVTWNSTNVFNDSHQNDKLDKWDTTPLTYEGITISFNGSGAASNFFPYDPSQEKAVLQCFGGQGAVFTFTAPSGKKFKKIEINNNAFLTFTDYGDWTKSGLNTIVWNGTAANAVTLGGSATTNASDLSSIEFTLEDAD